MRTTFPTFLFLLLAVMVNAQETSRKDTANLFTPYFEIRQKEGTNKLLKEYLMPYVQEEQVFAVLFTPKACPRCEAEINVDLDLLREIRPGKEPVLIAAYPDAGAAKEYLKRFHARNVVIDTEGKHEEIFHFNAGGLNVTYLLQIDMRQGRLMHGGDIMQVSKENLERFCSNTAYFPYHAAEDAASPVEETTVRERVAQGTHPAIRMEEREGKSITSGKFYSPAWQGRRFLYADDLASVGRLYETAGDTARFVQEIVPDSAQERAFVDLPAGDYERYKEKGMISIMACVPAFAPSGTPLITYSVPNMFEEKEDEVVYYSKPVALALEEPGGKCRMAAFDFELDSIPYYMYMHATSFCPVDEGRVLFGCRKVYSKGEYDVLFNDIRAGKCADIDNIYSDAFYEHAPVAALFGMEDGKKLRQIGQLDGIFKETRTGYFFTMFTGGIHGKRLAYTDGFSGKLYVSNTDTYETEKEIALFRVEVKDLEKKLANQCEITYFEQFFGDFNRQITEVQPDGGGIHCLLRTGKDTMMDENDLYEYIYVDYDGNILKRVPIVYEEGDDVLAVSLHREKDGTAAPYYFCKNSKGVFLKTIETD